MICNYIKKYCVKSLLTITILLLISSLSNAQWVKTDGPSYVAVYGMALFDSTLFIGTNDEIYTSTDKGDSWIQADSGFSTLINQNRAHCFAANKYYTFAGTEDGVFCSSDKGKIWTRVLYTNYINALLVIDSTIFAGSIYGLFRSTDNGANWFKSISGMNKEQPYILSIDSNGDNVFVVADGVIYLSTNNGLNWNPINNGLPIGIDNFSIKTVECYGDNIFLGTSRGMYISKNNGEEWKLVTSMLPTISVYKIAVNDSNILAGTDCGIFVSTDNGNSWIERNKGLPSENVYSIETNGTDTYISLWHGGVYYSSNYGREWKNINVGLPKSNFLTTLTLSSNEDRLFAGTNNHGVFISTDKGVNWINSSYGLPFHQAVKSFAHKGNNTFVALYDKGVYFSSDGGNSWKAKNNGFLSEIINSLVSTDSSIVAGANNIIYTSINDGFQWMKAYSCSHLINCVHAKSNYVFAGLAKGMLRSSDYGKTWAVIDSGTIIGKQVYSITSNSFYVYAGTNAGVYKSSDNGNSWCLFSSRDNLQSINTIVANDYTVYAASYDSLFQNVNNDEVWSSINLIDSAIKPIQYSLMIYDSKLYVGTSSCVWYCPISDLILDVEDKNPLPAMSNLSQNYPNPFNPSTTIEYAIPAVETRHASSLHVLIKVFDILGREVATLVNENKPAGNYSIKFDGNNLPSGIYFYQLRAGDFTETRKMVLMK